MHYTVPGVGEITLETIILDLNGTLAVHSVVPEGVAERIQKIQEMGCVCVVLR